MQDKDTIKELLLNYFKGSVSVIQKKWIDDWVNESPENEELFYVYLEEWERKNPQYLTDTEQAILNFKNKSESPFASNDKITSNQKSFKRSNFKLFLVASVMLFGLLFLGTFERITVKTYRTGYGELATVILNDGTEVFLNANSQLKTPRFAFLGNPREVQLSGEASFNVTHDAVNKFIVQTMNGLDVVVHGTEFTVYNRRHNTEVHLKSGKVELIKHSPSGSESVLMQPGEKMRMENDGQLKKEMVQKPEEFASWKEHRYVFDKTSLSEIASLMNDNYGVEVEILGDSINDLTLSGSFRSEDAKEFANAVAQVLGISMEINDKRFRFFENE